MNVFFHSSDYLKVKFNLTAENETEMTLISKVSKFLSGAGDRDGGAAERKRAALLRSLDNA